MRSESEKRKWYALQLKTRFEKVVAQHLRGKGYEEYLPTYRSRRHWSDRIKEIECPLFPGYIFCKFDLRDRLPLLIIPGVRSVVSFGGAACPIPEEEILAVQRVVNSGMQYGPWSELSEMGTGQAVQVKVGPLRGLKGVIVRVKDKHHLVISIAMLQRYVSVEIDRDSVMPIGKDQPRFSCLTA
jgi:transcription antitermination factor NusG